jgi:peroxiredoxin Q/BCP
MKTCRDMVAICVVGAAVLALHSTAVFAGSSGLTIGDQAPGFELPGSDGSSYRLADFRGKQVVVLAWFPKAFTGG